MREQSITIAGRLAGDPEVRFTPSGAAVASFTVAYTPSKYDKTSGQWQDGETQWWRCQAWNQGKLTLAENIANVFKKGDAVLRSSARTPRPAGGRDGHCKSSEGHISVRFGNYWERAGNPEGERLKVTEVTICSYVLGPSRSHDFNTTAEALEAVKEWHKGEMANVYCKRCLYPTEPAGECDCDSPEAKAAAADLMKAFASLDVEVHTIGDDNA